MTVWRFPGLDALPGIAAGASTRKGGVSAGVYAELNLSRSTGDDSVAVRENRRRFAAALGFDPARQVFAEQVHGNRLAVMDGAGARMAPGVDGLVTDRPGVALTAMSADCPCMVAYDPTRHVAGAAHASWRGTAQDMAGALVRELAARFGSRPDDLHVALAPAIGPCCFDVREDFVVAIRAALPYADDYLRRPDGNGRRTFDLWSCNRRQLADAGVCPEHIEGPEACSVCRLDLFYSYRRDGPQGGRFGTVIVMQP
ncbi:MAG: peptidoglycan editing factor PgeF [Planctomycetes bacterium]|nr:peptidoglycan editing factor PgeF [Planctomycetota bacterium]